MSNDEKNLNDGNLPAEVAAFISTINELYGHYIDSIVGFMANFRMINEAQQKVKSEMPQLMDLDSIAFAYGNSKPTDPTNNLQHQTTQGDYKRRNLKGGRNHILAAQLLIVLIFSFWEHEYRPKFAAALGLKNSTDLKVPLFGDLKFLRNDIVHHKGIVTRDTIKKISEIRGLQEGKDIALNEKEVELMIQGIKCAMDTLVVKAGFSDPNHRTIWHIV
jgi:hypothetical protein